MPARIGPLCAAALQQPPPLFQHRHHKVFFHNTPIRQDEIDDKNHYETLNIQTSASPADIKKSFYALSKTHHPDHNRSDPNASRRFMRISEAYSTLSHTEKRAKYDRDVLRLHDKSAQQHGGTHVRTGSYSSTGPAGGRPASGLSRRRGTFRGPPPSFYRSGGWGAHGAKRSAAHEGSTSSGGESSSSSRSQQQYESPQGSAYTSYNAGGMGPGQEPFGRGSASADMPHFDRTAQTQHTQTHARHEARRAQRMAHEYDPFPASSGDLGDVGRIFAVLGVLGLGGVVPYLLLKGSGATGKKQVKT